jgi:3-oxoacyl-[acyl-carrier-protein] synthase II
MPILTEVVVTGIGLNSALGNLSQTWHSLLQQKSAIQIQQPFADLPPVAIASMDQTPINLTTLTQNVVREALADANLTPPLRDCAIILGSSRGFQSIWEDFMTKGEITPTSTSEDQLWLKSLPHQTALIAAQEVGSQNMVIAPMAACATGLVAIARGFELITMGQCERAIVGAVESPITPLTLAAFHNAGALAQTGCYPFDQAREGLVLGEGGAVFVLESATLAQQRGAKIYGKILGGGLSCDAFHISAPSPDAHGAKQAIRTCLKRSQLRAEQIQLIHAHGTSTRLNDEMEAHLIKSLFPPSVAVTSTKGATGHTLGASGALGVAFCLMALQTQRLPPCIGLNKPDFPLNFVLKPQGMRLEHILCLSFGFGGQNSAIALSKI